MFQKKENHPNWKGGRILRNGYWYILKPDHPFAHSNGYIREHRLVYEHYLKIIFDEVIYIPKNIEIDHDNEDTLDNSLINLNCFTHKQHRKKHRIDKTNRLCLLCNSKTSIDKNGWERWYHYENEYICDICYKRNKRRNK